MTAVLHQVFDYALLAFGFGFVIFFHELGHFLAAKYCGVKVEQFAVGFGHAAFAWRKGFGFGRGTTFPAYKKRVEEYLDAKRDKDLQLKDHVGSWTDEQIAGTKELNFSETEYRLNWIPLGGYVKMLGQDDLRPEATASDPRAYNNKSIRARMLIVSAGVIMNIILAAIGFMFVFLCGWPTPAAVVGSTISQSPAMNATLSNGSPTELRPGDEIVFYNGKAIRTDFSKLILESALSSDGPVTLLVRRHAANYDAKTRDSIPLETVILTPAHPGGELKSFLAMGINQPYLLEGFDVKSFTEDKEDHDLVSKESFAINPGDVITAIEGKPVQVQEIWKLSDALENSGGNPVKVTVRRFKTGQEDPQEILPHFEGSFSNIEGIDILGLVPRVSIEGISPKSPARGMLHVGDVVVGIKDPDQGDKFIDPDSQLLRDEINKAGQGDRKVNFMVLRDGKVIAVDGLDPNISLPNNRERKGLNIQLGAEELGTVVSTVRPKSKLDGLIKNQDTITAINGQPVHNWFQIRTAIASATPEKDLTISFTSPEAAGTQIVTVKPSAADIHDLKTIVIAKSSAIGFRTMDSNRQTSNPFVAIGWGAVETHDLILQFYLTLRRMLTGGIPLGQVMGPIGIFSAGAQFAAKGTVWLLWFLAMISANLAVVNFLPIPIVDGGLFTFLILEKIQGRPLSPNTQKIVQYFGLALILGVFVLVTYQDIARMAGY